MEKTKNKNQKKNISQTRQTILSFKTAIFFIYGLVIAAAFYHIIGVNELSTKGYQLYEFKARLAELNEEATALELKTIKLSSIQDVSGRAESIGLVKIDKIEYLAVKNEAMARAEEASGP